VQPHEAGSSGDERPRGGLLDRAWLRDADACGDPARDASNEDHEVCMDVKANLLSGLTGDAVDLLAV